MAGIPARYTITKLSDPMAELVEAIVLGRHER